MRRNKWWQTFECRKEFWVAWHLAFAIVPCFRPTYVGLFFGGVNTGFAISNFLERKQQRRLTKIMEQDEVDLRTLHQIVNKMTHKTLHHMDKHPFN